MLYFNVFFQEVAAIFLFFYSIEKFSNIILDNNLEKIKSFFAKACNTKLRTILTGIFATMILQSSTAVSTLAVTLTNANIFNVYNAMLIIFGAAIGTSSTSLLVSLKITSMEEICIIVGAVLKIFAKNKKLGGLIFYLGLLLFSIERMTIATSTLKNFSLFKYFFLDINNVFQLFIMGTVLTIILQSSSLVVSILVILISQDAITMSNAINICIGAFVGTTFTSFVVSLSMSKNAKQVGILNAGISFVAGFFSLIFIPFFVKFGLLFKNPGTGLAFANIFLKFFLAFISVIILNFIYQRKF